MDTNLSNIGPLSPPNLTLTPLPPKVCQWEVQSCVVSCKSHDFLQLPTILDSQIGTKSPFKWRHERVFFSEMFNSVRQKYIIQNAHSNNSAIVSEQPWAGQSHTFVNQHLYKNSSLITMDLLQQQVLWDFFDKVGREKPFLPSYLVVYDLWNILSEDWHEHFTVS